MDPSGPYMQSPLSQWKNTDTSRRNKRFRAATRRTSNLNAVHTTHPSPPTGHHSKRRQCATTVGGGFSKLDLTSSTNKTLHSRLGLLRLGGSSARHFAMPQCRNFRQVGCCTLPSRLGGKKKTSPRNGMLRLSWSSLTRADAHRNDNRLKRLTDKIRNIPRPIAAP